MKVTDLYLLTALSNLHVGRGDSNYGIVDNEVQRDPITNYPTVFASSLKGALRETTKAALNGRTIEVFGSEVGDTRDADGKTKKLRQGDYTFHQAYLLSMPVRGETHPFYHATTADLLREMQEQVDLLMPRADGLSNALANHSSLAIDTDPAAGGKEYVDEYETVRFTNEQNTAIKQLQNKHLLDTPAAVFSAKQFGEISERLPVIARNQLKQGISKNLFYEEIVPRRTRFYFFVERPADKDHLEEVLATLNHRIQLGANATIGYGVCTLQRIATTAKTQ